MAVYQDAKFITNSKHSHDNVVKRIDKCLKGTNEKGLILKMDLKKSLEMHADSDIAGAYDKDASEYLSTVHSRIGFIIKHDNCPITWKSKL